MKAHPIIHSLKQKEICDYIYRPSVPRVLMFNDMIMNMISNMALEDHKEGVDSFSTKIENKIIYMYRGSLQYLYWKKDTNEIIDVPCVHLKGWRILMRQYLTKILKHDTSKYDMKEKIPLVEFLWKVSQEVYYYAYRIIQLFIS